MLFQPATNQAAYLKPGLFGFEGSGKTFTASLLGIGLHHHIKSQKPVAFFDTETGSDYVKPLFDKAKVPLVVYKSRALAQLGEATQEAEGAADIMILDSLTHVYNEVMGAYVKKKNDGTNYVRMPDWQPIKEAWRK